jgi:hypothetical protein
VRAPQGTIDVISTVDGGNRLRRSCAPNPAGGRQRFSPGRPLTLLGFGSHEEAASSAANCCGSVEGAPSSLRGRTPMLSVERRASPGRAAFCGNTSASRYRSARSVWGGRRLATRVPVFVDFLAEVFAAEPSLAFVFAFPSRTSARLSPPPRRRASASRARNAQGECFGPRPPIVCGPSDGLRT